MANWKMSYKGRDIGVEQSDEEHAEVTIDDRTFAFTLHDGPLRMWMCDEAYFGAPELPDVIKHLVDYWYVITDEEHKAPAVNADELAPAAGPVQAGVHKH